MTMQALSTLELNLLGLGTVEITEVSTPTFFSAALKKIGTEFFNDAQAHSDKFSSISESQLIIAATKKFVDALEESEEETSATEVSTSSSTLEKTKTVIVDQGFVSEETQVEDAITKEVLTHGEALEKAASPSALSHHDITALGQTTLSHDTFEKINEAFSEVQETRIELATLGLEWSATTVEVLSHHAEALVHGLEKGAASFALVGLVAKVDKIHKTVLEVKAVEEVKPSILVSLGFSIVEVLSNGLNFLSKIGVISHAMAALGRFNLIGAFCTLVIAVVNLGDNITNYKDMTSLFKALVTLVADAAMLGLIYYAGGHVGVLLLILGTGIFLLNVAIPDEEHHEVKTAH